MAHVLYCRETHRSLPSRPTVVDGTVLLVRPFHCGRDTHNIYDETRPGLWVPRPTKYQTIPLRLISLHRDAPPSSLEGGSLRRLERDLGLSGPETGVLPSRPRHLPSSILGLPPTPRRDPGSVESPGVSHLPSFTADEPRRVPRPLSFRAHPSFVAAGVRSLRRPHSTPVSTPRRSAQSGVYRPSTSDGPDHRGLGVPEGPGVLWPGLVQCSCLPVHNPVVVVQSPRRGPDPEPSAVTRSWTSWSFPRGAPSVSEGAPTGTLGCPPPGLGRFPLSETPLTGDRRNSPGARPSVSPSGLSLTL